LEEKSTTKVSLLDLYSDCGGMSTGLCLGADLARVKLEMILFYFIIFPEVTYLQSGKNSAVYISYVESFMAW
jgi:hypothetical protein